MFSLIEKVEAKYKKQRLVDVRSGDTVRVHQRITEGSKTRTQVFEGLVIRTRKLNSLQASILVRRIASGVGVEKGFLLHSPNVEKVEVVKRAKVRRNYLSYMRARGGKSARLASVNFDKDLVNKANEPAVPADTTKEAKEAEKELADETIEKVKEQATKPASEKTETVEAKTEESKAEATEEPKVEGKPVETAEAKAEEKTEKPAEEDKADKAADKKAKAEAFRQAQQNK